MHSAARHCCLIYTGSPKQQLPYIASLLIEELRGGTRCVYLHSPEMVSAMRAHLSSAGVDVEAEIDERTLILSSDRSYLIDGRFEAAGMLDSLVAMVAEAKAEGFLKLWISGDMTWEFGDHGDFTELLAFERGSELLFEQYPMLNAICQYHQGTLPPSALHDALCTHKSVYLNEAFFRVNPYFAPPPATQASIHIPADIQSVMEHLRQHQ